MRFHFADLFEELESQTGLVDLWRATNGKNQEWTWLPSKWIPNRSCIREQPGFMHRFGPIRCHYDHTPREAKITNHNAVGYRTVGHSLVREKMTGDTDL